jgi:hypothetical protein
VLALVVAGVLIGLWRFWPKNEVEPT